VRDHQLKPLVKIKRPPFLAKRQYSVLTRALEEALFRHADVISEGATRHMPKVGNTYFGSTMIAIAFDRLATETHQKFTRHARASLVNVVEGSVRVRLRCMRLARAEAVRRVTDARIGTVLCDLRVHEDGAHLRIDVDLEAPMRISSRAVRADRHDL
jgi:hypothetical protein